jgi:cytochrome bd-type quinol oxidase subunit 2
MDEAMPYFWLRLIAVLAVIGAVVAVSWWQTRFDRQAFSLARVFFLAVLCGLVAAMFVLLWWRASPAEVESQRGLLSRNPLLFAAVFVPIAAIYALVVFIALRTRRKKYDNTQT